MAWYDDIEEQIIATETQKQYRNVLTVSEAQLLNMEADILQRADKNGKCKATYYEQVRTRYRTDSGRIVDDTETVLKQDTDYIYSQLQQRLRLRHMSYHDLERALQIISAVFQSAEAHGHGIPSVVATLERVT